VLRKERFAKQQALGLAGPSWHLPERPANIPAWDSLDAKAQDFEDLRMATYAAMIDCVDQGVGRVMQTVDELKLRDDTLVLFLNDNGASPNDRARNGDFGAPGSNWNTGVGWAQASTTPFKFYKRTQHSGGITTPFIAHWPAAIQPRKEYEDQPCQIADLLPTLIEISGGSYPANFGGKQHPPLTGRSFAPILMKDETLPPRTLHFALFNNLALIHNDWKIVTAYNQAWQLYDLKSDRTETHDLAQEQPEKLAELLALQKSFHAQTDVSLRLGSGEREPEYAPPFKADGSKGPGSQESVPDEAHARNLIKARAAGSQLTEEEVAALKPKSDTEKTSKKKKQKKKSK
jgi:arylsulfatase